MTVDCELISMHLPPSQSLYYADTEIDNGFFLLEYCIIVAVECKWMHMDRERGEGVGLSLIHISEPTRRA